MPPRKAKKVSEGVPKDDSEIGTAFAGRAVKREPSSTFEIAIPITKPAAAPSRKRKRTSDISDLTPSPQKVKPSPTVAYDPRELYPSVAYRMPHRALTDEAVHPRSGMIRTYLPDTSRSSLLW